MKKIYEKPWIYMEQLQLAEHIAACDWKLNSADANNCVAQGELDGFEGTVTIFLDTAKGCVLTDEYCNYTANDQTVTFNS